MTTTTLTSKYRSLIRIESYVWPSYLIQPMGGQFRPAEIGPELEGCTVEMVDADIKGWDEFTEVIASTDEHGETRHYLAVPHDHTYC